MIIIIIIIMHNQQQQHHHHHHGNHDQTHAAIPVTQSPWCVSACIAKFGSKREIVDCTITREMRERKAREKKYKCEF